jgi:hypothetical protein
MKILLLFLSIFVMFTACKRPNSKIKERISNADSVAINYFKGDGTMDTVVAVKIVKDKKVIEQLSNLISASSAAANIKCGYDGSLHFFKKNMVVQDIDFRMNDAECMYFSFKQEGRLTATVLSPEAKQLLQSIWK